MDVKKVFRGISQKLQTDFEISAEINHQGNKGTYREVPYVNFLFLVACQRGLVSEQVKSLAPRGMFLSKVI